MPGWPRRYSRYSASRRRPLAYFFSRDLVDLTTTARAVALIIMLVAKTNLTVLLAVK